MMKPLCYGTETEKTKVRLRAFEMFMKSKEKSKISEKVFLEKNDQSLMYKIKKKNPALVTIVYLKNDSELNPVCVV